MEKLVEIGGEVGLKPQEIYDMEYWEFHHYLKGYRERKYKEHSDMIRVAYYTAMYTNAKKAKPLEHYLDALEKQHRKGERKNEPVNKELSLSILEKIEKLKKGGDVT